MTLGGAPHGGLEAGAQGVFLRARLGGGAEAFPLATGALDRVERIDRSRLFDAFAEFRARTQMRLPAFGDGAPLGFLALEPVDLAACLRDERPIPRGRLGVEVERAVAGHQAPFLFRVVELCGGVLVARVGRDGFDPGEHRRHAFLELFERDTALGLRVVDRLEDGARTLRHALALGALGHRFERVADLCSAASGFDRSLERGDAGIFVIRLQRDGDQLGGIGEPRDGIGRGLRIGRVPRHAAQQLRVVNTSKRGRAHGVVRGGLGDRGEVFLVVEPLERERRAGVGRRPRGRDTDELFDVVPPQLLVALPARELHQVLYSRQPGAGGTADAEVRVFARQLTEHAKVLFVVR